MASIKTESRLSHKDRTLRALRHEPVDRLPTQINYTGDMGLLMAEQLGVGYHGLAEALDNHLIRVDMDHVNRRDASRRIVYDWWGVGFSDGKEGYLAKVSPLAEDRDLDRYSWPDANEPGLLDSAQAIIEARGDDYFIVPNIGFALFERAWTMRGMEQFLLDMALDKVWVGELLDRITEITLAIIHRYLDLGVHGGYFGDDYGGKSGLLFSPKMWRTLYKPRLARLFEPFRERDMPVILQSDGHIQSILPDLVEIGVTVLTPVQPEVIDHRWLRREYGDKLAYYGGISTQSTLPKGTPAEIRQTVRDTAATLAPEGTGLLIAPSHRMTRDIPMLNVGALIDSFQQL